MILLGAFDFHNQLPSCHRRTFLTHLSEVLDLTQSEVYEANYKSSLREEMKTKQHKKSIVEIRSPKKNILVFFFFIVSYLNIVY